MHIAYQVSYRVSSCNAASSWSCSVNARSLPALFRSVERPPCGFVHELGGFLPTFGEPAQGELRKEDIGEELVAQ